MRRLIASTCLFAGVAFAQLPGQFPGQYPGGQYPGQGPTIPIPGQRRPQGQSRPAPSTSRGAPSRPLELRDTSGILRKLSKDEIIIESTDHRIVWFHLGDTVKINPEKFQMGDHLVVSSNEDEEGNYTAISIQWESKGSAEDRAAAAQTWDLPGQIDTPVERLPVEQRDERPKLTRATPANAPEVATVESNDEAPKLVRKEPVETPQGPSVEAEDKDERPRLVRGKPTNTTAAPPAQAAKREPIEVPPPQVAQPTTAEAPQPKVVAVATPEPEAQPEEVPPNVHIHTGAMPAGPDDPAIAKAREAAVTFLESLPRFSAKQNTTRYVQEGARSQWQAQDLVTANLVYRDGAEEYTDVKVNNKPSKKAETAGLHTTGEFGTIMNNLFDPDTGAIFTKPTQVQIRGRKAWSYKFSVIRTRSDFRIETPSQLFYSPYQGTVWIDFETSRLLRIEMQAAELPKAFPFDTVELNIDYDFIRLDGAAQFLLPTESEALNCIRGTPVCMKNTTSFRNYVKFDAKSDIIFDK